MSNNKEEPATLAVGGESRDQLLTWLSQSPKTHDWDAIVAYNRGRANALLMQQYIKKLTADNYLSPIDGDISGPEGSKMSFFGIQLGIPRLSFENANLGNSKAKVTQAITAGLAILKSEAVGGYTGIGSIIRPNGAAGPTLWMDVELENVSGDVSQAGSVVIDLANMKDFDTDLFSDTNSINNAKKFFTNRFKENPELHKYTLGTLSQTADSALTPQNFEIRTQPVPGAKVRGAPNFGDGAVVLFITLKGGTGGGVPTEGSDFKYLIPNDENGEKYSSAVILSNKTLFNKLLLPTLNQNPRLTYALQTPTDGVGTPLHAYAQATRGDFVYPTGTWFDSQWEWDDGNTHKSHLKSLEETVLKVITAGEWTGLRIQPLNNSIHISWKAAARTKWNQKVDVEDGIDTDVDGYLDFRVDAEVNMESRVNASSGVIEFSTDSRASENFDILNMEWLKFFNSSNRAELSAVFHTVMDRVLFDWFITFKIPDIDTFLLRNLLFPDNNAMVLTDAYVPGDLAIFGNVDPSLTSFAITPEHPVLLIGSTRQFNTEPAAANVTWSVRALPGDTTPYGSINSSGLYTAPSADDLHGRDAQQVIVTATGTAARGTAASSSTVVSIVHQTISVNPMFCIRAPEGEPMDFSAGTTDNSTLTWAMKDPGQNGKLEPTTGLTSAYTAARPANNAFFVLDVIEVRDASNNLGQAEVLVINGIIGGQVTVDLKDAAQHKAQLQFLKHYDGGPIDIPHELLTWTLLAGTGHVDALGLYHAPELEQPGYALITCRMELPSSIPQLPPTVGYGYTVLPLPLTAYPDMVRVYT